MTIIKNCGGIYLNAQGNGSTNNYDGNYVDGHVDASSGYDEEFDIPQPPMPPEDYILVYLPHQGWENNLFENFDTEVIQ